MLSWGVEHKRIGSNPLAKFEPLPDDSPKEGRALSPDEVSRLLEAATPHYKPIWYAFLVTGMRRDEVINLLFSDVDWDSRELVVRGGTAKNHTARRVPIDDELYDTLKGQVAKAKDRQPGCRGGTVATVRIVGRLSRDHVFVTAQNTPLGGNVYREFMRTCARAKIETETLDAEGKVVEHVDLHSLRRTFATNAIENGADPKTVQELNGHKTLAMTMKIYAGGRPKPSERPSTACPTGSGVHHHRELTSFRAPANQPASGNNEPNARQDCTQGLLTMRKSFCYKAIGVGR